MCKKCDEENIQGGFLLTMMDTAMCAFVMGLLFVLHNLLVLVCIHETQKLTLKFNGDAVL
jgi:acyl-coenzyme A thioesterase PaaI-like protein